MTDDAAGNTDANDSASAADTVVSSFSAYDAVVYDLDGTLVDLAVDWGAVAEAVLDVYAEHAIKPPTAELWGLLGAADEYGIRAPVEATITEHERAGARDSTLLPLGHRLAEAGQPASVGVCSLNSEAACRVAIETHGLGGALESDAVVGRDTAETYKPEPESLLAAVDRLGTTPDRALFVGDSERDAVTAERAGTDYAWVTALLD